MPMTLYQGAGLDNRQIETAAMRILHSRTVTGGL